jgi:hypothetical protein
MLYEGCAAGARGVEQLRSHMTAIGSTAIVRSSAWRFNALQAPGARDRFLDDASTADVIVIASAIDTWRNQQVDKLLIAYLARRDRKPATLLISDPKGKWALALDADAKASAAALSALLPAAQAAA